jgi:AcrR family transcriptional regulator
VQPQPALKLGKSERTRAVILNASLDFLWSHPFRDMTVGSLMAATGVSRSAFYQYFEDRHELMETLLDMLQDEIFEVAAPWISGTGDPVALLRETLSGLARAPSPMPPQPTNASRPLGRGFWVDSTTRLASASKPTRTKA